MLDAYDAYAKSDSVKNLHFPRRWQERPFSPAEIDRLADFALAFGHHRRAEELSRQAADLREARS